MNKMIGIIGMGHMGKALYEGLLLAGVKKEQIVTSDNSQDNKNVATQADVIFLAVKPLLILPVIEEIKDVINDKSIISVAWGVSIDDMAKQIGNMEQKIVRLMPNLPVAYGQGVLGFFASQSLSQSEKDEIITLLSGLGTVVACQTEEQVDMMTILSGSGPAVVAYCLSLFEQAGKSFGFEKDVAQTIAHQTFVGTLELLQKKQQTAEELQNAVATKGGTTEQIINYLDEEEVSIIFQKSFDAGYARIKKLREELKK